MDKPSDADMELQGEHITLHFDAWSAWVSDGEPTSFRTDQKGKILVNDFALEVDVEVGTFYAISMDVEGAINERVSPFDLFDVEQSSVGYFGLYDGLSGIKDSVMKVACGTDYVWCANLLIIDRLEIDPKYRGQGHGLAAMRALILKLRGGAGLIAIKPFPLQFEGGYRTDSEQFIAKDYGSLSSDPRTAMNKLRRHYASLGFKRVPRTPYMVMDVQRKLPTLSELRGHEKPARKSRRVLPQVSHP